MPCDDSGRIVHCLERESIRRECEASLKRLGIGAIDLYQIHWNKPAEQVTEALETLADLKAEGKIRHIGVSNFTVDELKTAREIAGAVSLQPPFSLIDRQIENEILPFCKEQGIGVIAYSPMHSGLLSGKMTRERIASFAQDDLRRSKAEFNEPQLTGNLLLVEHLREIGQRHNVSPAEIAVAWTIRSGAADAAIVGMWTADNAESIISAADIQLRDDDLIDIEYFSEQI